MKPVRVLLALDRRYRFDRDVFAGVAQVAEGHGGIFLDLVTEGVTLAQALAGGDRCGVVVATSDPAEIDAVVATGLPCVNVANHLAAHAWVPVVGNDDAALGQLVADHYLGRGFKRFAYFSNRANPYFDARRDAFCRAVRAAGLACAVGPPLDDPGRATAGPQAWAAQWLGGLPKPLAVMCPFDGDGREAIQACQLAGLRVPEEVSVVGVDNDPHLCLTIAPPLSSVATPALRIGRTAMALLLSMVDGQPPPARPILVAPVEVVERGSTGDVAIDDPDVAAAVHYIRAHLRDRLTVAVVADQVAVSRRTLERKFATLLRRTPLEEVRRLRVEQAKRLLVNTDLALKEVARLSGLIHAQRLSNLIKADTGLTPGQLRDRSGRAGAHGRVAME